MNNDQLRTGKNLSESIERLETHKKAWENSTGKINDLNIQVSNNSSTSGFSVNTDYVNFDVLKALTLDTINKKIADLQKEFAAL